MPSANSLGKVRQGDDRLLQGVQLGVFRRGHDDPRGLRHRRIAESVRIVRKRAGQPGHVGTACGELRILDRVDPLGERNDKAIELIGQLRNIFLGGSDWWLTFVHLPGIIGWCPAKLESLSMNQGRSRSRAITQRLCISLAIPAILQQA